VPGNSIRKFKDVVSHRQQLCLLARGHTQVLQFSKLSFVSTISISVDIRYEGDSLANSSDLFRVMRLPVLRMETTLSLGDSSFAPARRFPRQKLVLLAFIAHWTAASNICLESCHIPSICVIRMSGTDGSHIPAVSSQLTSFVRR